MEIKNLKSVADFEWDFKSFDDENTNKIKEKLNIPLTLAKILDQKGFSEENAESFLNPKVKNDLKDPFSFKDMKKASDRIIKAIRNNEKIGIFGDYDVDGATSSSLLYNYLKSVNPELDIDIHIPDREKEGYGLNTQAIEKFKKDDRNLVISVDCGIASLKEADFAKEINVDLIIIDHHNQASQLPNSYATVNPKREDSDGDFHYLAAVGVVFFVCIAINSTLKKENYFNESKIEEPNLINLLDIVALGTVCDSVPLTDLNRSIVSTGLKIIDKEENIGIKALSEISQSKKSSVYSLGFILGPRINAGGRIGDSSIGAKLLTCTNPIIAENHAKKLNDYNAERKSIEGNIFEEAISQITPEMLEKQYIFVKSKNWHKGIIGIVASKIKEMYNLPTFIATEIKDGILNGSGRSSKDYNLGQTIINAKEKGILKEGGGHKMAAGFTFEEKNEEDFKKAIETDISNFLENKNFKKVINISSILDIKAINIKLIERIESLSPFGIGNPEPKFAISNARLMNFQALKNGVAKAIFSSDSGGSITGMIFNSTPCKIRETLEKNIGKNFLAIGKIQISEFNGRKTTQIILEDLGILDNSKT
ncbi:MAG: single-stranded-DNA-specific exonuclease RecJ [Alphaproteobacteria bacterium]|nr:single-stranded-DNA-specific exonuclease RecJ [Alphaproteobacteria bacterium]